MRYIYTLKDNFNEYINGIYSQIKNINLTCLIAVVYLYDKYLL